MGQWSREELEEAFHNYEQAVVRISETWDWSSYADQFTEDATYVEHALGSFSGREQIREWISSTMSSFPGNEMPFFPSIDDERVG
jgi:SnoaL-like domain